MTEYRCEYPLTERQLSHHWIEPSSKPTYSKRSLRRHQAHTKMWRRLKEDRNQHYDDLTCPCWTNLKAMARFKEQPKVCACWMCGSQRRWHGPRPQEARELYRTDIELKERTG